MQPNKTHYIENDTNNLLEHIKELEAIKLVAMELRKSYECYAATNKPEVEWDEYDYMINPIWLKLLELIPEKKENENE